MSGKPKLKLTFGKPKGPQAPKQPSVPAASPPPTTTPTPTVPKLKLKFGPKPTPAPAPPAPQAPQTASAPKSKKAAKPTTSKDAPKSSKKRARDTTGNKETTAVAPTPAPAVKRIKFSTKPLPSIRLKSKGEPPRRPRGAGYDSEASDTEIDPALEEEFILRMPPGDDCDYVRQAVEDKRFGPRSQGGADISFKSLTRDGRRATVTVRGKIYAATLVDLPCVIEAMKSWDRRAWYKTADICQMLLVLGPVKSEEEARNYPLPKDVDQSSFQYAHGVTPPMRWVRKRRFRKRISNRTIEAVELEVARLIREDASAVRPPEFEVMDYNQYMREGSTFNEEYDDEQDAEGEVDEAGYMESATQEDMADLFEDDLAAEMEAALAAHADAKSVPTSAIADENQTVGELPQAEPETEAEMSTPKPATAGETSGDEEDESEESSPEDAEELDDDALEQQRQIEQQREEIAELEALVRAETLKWEQMTNPILKGKLGRRVQSLKQELELRKVSIGEGNADD